MSQLKNPKPECPKAAQTVYLTPSNKDFGVAFASAPGPLAIGIGMCVLPQHRRTPPKWGLGHGLRGLRPSASHQSGFRSSGQLTCTVQVQACCRLPLGTVYRHHGRRSGSGSWHMHAPWGVPTHCKAPAATIGTSPAHQSRCRSSDQLT